MQHQILEPRLAEHAERALEADDVAGVAQRGVDVILGEEPPVLVDEQERDDQRELAEERPAEA